MRKSWFFARFRNGHFTDAAAAPPVTRPAGRRAPGLSLRSLAQCIFDLHVPRQVVNHGNGRHAIPSQYRTGNSEPGTVAFAALRLLNSNLNPMICQPTVPVLTARLHANSNTLAHIVIIMVLKAFNPQCCRSIFVKT